MFVAAHRQQQPETPLGDRHHPAFTIPSPRTVFDQQLPTD